MVIKPDYVSLLNYTFMPFLVTQLPIEFSLLTLRKQLRRVLVLTQLEPRGLHICTPLLPLLCYLQVVSFEAL
jgi:hypothetical protein